MAPSFNPVFRNDDYHAIVLESTIRNFFLDSLRNHSIRTYFYKQGNRERAFKMKWSTVFKTAAVAGVGTIVATTAFTCAMVFKGAQNAGIIGQNDAPGTSQAFHVAEITVPELEEIRGICAGEKPLEISDEAFQALCEQNRKLREMINPPPKPQLHKGQRFVNQEQYFPSLTA